MTTLGFIGLGVMGEPMCRNMAGGSGAALVAHDLSPEPLARLAAYGVEAGGSIAGVAKRASIVFLSLPGGKELETVCAELLPAVRAGQIVVDTSTSPVGLTRSMATQFAEQGVDYADAPIARTRQAAEDGTLSIMVGASEDVFRRIEPVLRCCGSEVTLCGDVGAGQVVKLMNNMVVTQTVVALAEALTVGRRAGVDGAVLFDTLTKGSADSFVLRNHGMQALLPGVFPERAFATDYMRKDLAYAMQLADEVGIGLRGAQTAKQLLAETSEAGYGNAYFPALLNVVDKG